MSTDVTEYGSDLSHWTPGAGNSIGVYAFTSSFVYTRGMTFSSLISQIGYAVFGGIVPVRSDVGSTADANDVNASDGLFTLAGPSASGTVTQLVLLRGSASEIIMIVDVAPTFIDSSNLSDLTITWDNGPNKVFSVSGDSGTPGIPTMSFDGGGGDPEIHAAIGASATSGHIPLTVNFNSSSSFYSEGAISSYSWDFDDGGTSTSANPSHIFSSPGTYHVTLEVTGGLLSDTDSITIEVDVFGNRWTVYDALDDSTYVFGINPQTGSFNSREKTIGFNPCPVPGGNMNVYEGRSAAPKSTASCTLLTEEMYDAMVELFNKRRILTVTDDLGRAFSINITSFTPKRVRGAVDFPWRHTFDLLYTVTG